ncbi:uncharacterized protein LOC143147783 isoform X2 [Ptiloglossa arizonensis]|uniref:uncharacterized protein LOC143147783 isoform X2 n=1 Tax=Ptiloglossa arizonensis TaxID=3350558 RepID=UPI003F9F41BE
MSLRKVFSLVFIRKTTEILLGLKKRGFGIGKWNGFGGKVEAGETILQGAIREVKEECGLSAKDLTRIGLLEFEFEGSEVLFEVHVFETYNFSGEIIESEVVCGVGADVAYHRHVMGFYVTAASGLIFFLEITWAITLFVQICVRNDESLCSCCWSGVLTITRGWRRALFYLPLSCILAWKPHSLWLSYVAGNLANRTFGSAILTAYCIQCFRKPRCLPDKQCHGFGRREPSKYEARELRSFRRSSGDGSPG